MTFKIEPSSRIARLPPYLFARINKMKYDKRVAGDDIIDLGMGNPTDPTPKIDVDNLAEAALVPDPAFPAHVYAVAMAGASVIRVPLGNDQALLDRIEHMIEGLYPTPKLLILNFPHNPTSMTIDDGKFW